MGRASSHALDKLSAIANGITRSWWAMGGTIHEGP